MGMEAVTAPRKNDLNAVASMDVVHLKTNNQDKELGRVLGEGVRAFNAVTEGRMAV
jgi:hypothetical protein